MREHQNRAVVNEYHKTSTTYSDLIAMSVQELEDAVSQLSPDELARFAEWFEEYKADEWDRQIEADAEAGLLDALGQQADEDFEAGRITEL